MPDVQKRIDELADKLGMPVDEGIKSTVAALWLWDFPTTGSCEGHLDRGLAFPWVDIGVGDRKANKPIRSKMRKFLEQFYEDRTSNYQIKMADKGLFGNFRLQSFPGIDYEGGAVDEAELLALRQEIKDFTAFLVLLKK